MKLINCYISSFGKIKDFSYDFNDGLNVILQENGWGKTTFTIFLKSMFYGLDDSKKNILENERLKYKPWGSSDLFGGHITFSYANQTFKIERYFGNKFSEDYANLTDLSTGKITPFNSDKEELGKRIFKVDKEGFLSTTFFSEKDFEIKSNASLTAKFNSTFDEQDTDLYDLAITKLDKKVKEFRQRGDKGLIPDTKRRLFDLREKINSESELSLAIEQIKKDVTLTEQELISLRERESLFNSQYEKAVLQENLALKKASYDKLVSEKETLNAQVQKANSVLNGKTVKTDEIYAVKKTIEDYQKTKAKLEFVYSEYQQLNAKKEEKTQDKKPKPYYISLIVALLAVAMFFVNIFAGIGFSVLAISSLLFIVFSNNKKVDNSIEEYIISKEKSIKDYQSIVVEYERALNNFFADFNFLQIEDYEQTLEIIKQAVSIKIEALNRLSNIDFEISKIEKEGIQNVEYSSVDVESLKRQWSQLKEQIVQKSDYLSKRKLILRQYEEKLVQVGDYESEVSILAELLEEYNSSYEVFSLTMQFLTKADENLRVLYRKPLSDSFNKYLRLLTGKDLKADIDVDFNITVVENYGNKAYEFYSQGYKNVLEICKRLALIDLLFEDEKPFIVLDDPFNYMDENNLNGALQLIKQLQSEYQIIYLICHNSRSV